MALTVLVWQVPAWVFKVLMGLIVAAGVGAAVVVYNMLTTAPDDAFTLAKGYKELSDLKGKNPTQKDVSDILDKLKLNKIQLKVLYDGFEAEFKSTPVGSLQTIVTGLDAKRKSLPDDEE